MGRSVFTRVSFALLIFSSLVTAECSRAQIQAQCNQARYVSEQTLTFVQNLPSLPTSQVYHYYGNNYGVADGINVYFDDVLQYTVWVGAGNCSTTTNADTENDCRKGPVYWTNESGQGVLQNLQPQDLQVHFAQSLSVNTNFLNASAALVHLKIVVPPGTC